MSKSTLFVTGRFAEKRLKKILDEMSIDFEYEVWNAGVKVAALITESILMRRLPKPVTAARVVLPGRCRVNLNRLAIEFGTSFERGPDELTDLPKYFGRKGRSLDLSKHDLRLFAEIVDAPLLTLDELERRGQDLSRSGADVIDLGCLPDTPFPHLEEAVRRLQLCGLKVSVDSADAAELWRAVSAGADYILSLNEFTVRMCGVSRPILVPAEQGDLNSLIRAYKAAKALGMDPILDPILDPIHIGLANSIARYRELRARLPDAEIMMGTGNLTELTEVDSAGVTALLIGVCSELRITNALTVNVSSHTRRTLQEHDGARRMMFAAKMEESVPKGFGKALVQIHDLDPYPNDQVGIASLVSEVKDANYRIEVAVDGIHIFNCNCHWIAKSAFELFDKLSVENDPAHAFYLGAELQKADIAYQLGKRYVQDEPINWGVATDSIQENQTRLSMAGQILRARKTDGA